MEKKNIIVLSGAGMSAESGIKTFRDADGLWEGHDVMQVASPQGFRKDPELVLEFYNQRRRQLKEVDPNPGHYALAELEEHHDVTVITQNIDDLHERAGSSQVIHLHGELRKVQSSADPNIVLDWEEDCCIGDTCPKGSQLRPAVVWFGEAVPKMEVAVRHIAEAEIVIIVGTSLLVYPAAGLVGYAPATAPVFYVDPAPKTNFELQTRKDLTIFSEGASSGLRKILDQLKGN